MNNANDLNFSLLELCEKNIYEENKYNLKEDIYLKEFGSKKEYINHLLELTNILKESKSKEFSFYTSCISTVLCCLSFFIAVNSLSKMPENILIFLPIVIFILTILVLITIFKAYNYSSPTKILKIYNFEKYLKKELEKLNAEKNYL